MRLKPPNLILWQEHWDGARIFSPTQPKN